MPTSSFELPVPGVPRDRLRQNELSRLLPDLNRILLTNSDLRQAFPQICHRLQPMVMPVLSVASSGDLGTVATRWRSRSERST